MFREMMSITSSGNLTSLALSSETRGVSLLIEHLILMVMGSPESWAFSCPRLPFSVSRSVELLVGRADLPPCSGKDAALPTHGDRLALHALLPVSTTQLLPISSETCD